MLGPRNVRFHGENESVLNVMATLFMAGFTSGSPPELTIISTYNWVTVLDGHKKTSTEQQTSSKKKLISSFSRVPVFYCFSSNVLPFSSLQIKQQELLVLLAMVISGIINPLKNRNMLIN